MPVNLRRWAATAAATASLLAVSVAPAAAGKATPVITISSCTVHNIRADISAAGGWVDLPRATDVFLGLTRTNTRPDAWSTVATTDWTEDTRTTGSFSVGNMYVGSVDTGSGWYLWVWIRQGRKSIYSESFSCTQGF